MIFSTVIIFKIYDILRQLTVLNNEMSTDVELHWSNGGTNTGPALLAFLYCEFDATLGPELVNQVPTAFYCKEMFNNVKKYIITKPELSSRTVAM